MTQKRMRLGDLLKQAGLITEEQIEEALKTKKEGQKLGDALLEKGYITEQQLIEVLEFQLGIPHINLYKYPIDPSLVNLISKEFALRHLVMPIKQEKDELVVAMNDPMDYFAIDDMRLATGFQITPVIATKEDILHSIHKYYSLSDTFDDLNINQLEEDELEGEEAPAVRLFNQILSMGIQLKASDIHIDPQEKNIQIRYRVDGIMHTERVLSRNVFSLLVARIKIMANLDITESRLPQDGRMKLEVNFVPVDLRISILPTVHGEKVVIRILDLSNVLIDLPKLGFNKVNYKKFLQMIERPSGMVLITGPTGSGKTTTLYAALNYLNKEEVNIITIEDPVEYQIGGVNQVQVNPQIGLDFATGLRSILRQDPNIIMVGEIRDEETADISVRASLTGHLVLSTLHTNSAITTIPRLFDMNIEPYLVVSSLTGVVAQRLVRSICKECRYSYKPSEMEKKLFERRGLKVDELYKGKGCNACHNTGYRGRLAIHEVFTVDDTVRNMLMNQQSINDIKKYALRTGMIFLIDDGLLKAKSGQTTVEEVLRVALEE